MKSRSEPDPWIAGQLAMLANDLARGAWPEASATALRVLEREPANETAKSGLALARAEIDMLQVNRARLTRPSDLIPISVEMPDSSQRGRELHAPTSRELGSLGPGQPLLPAPARSAFLDAMDTPFEDELRWSEVPAAPVSQVPDSLAAGDSSKRPSVYELDDPIALDAADLKLAAPPPLPRKPNVGVVTARLRESQSVRIQLAEESSAMDATLSPLTPAYSGSALQGERVRVMYSFFIDGNMREAEAAARQILAQEPDNAVASAVLAQCESAIGDKMTLPPVTVASQPARTESATVETAANQPRRAK